MANKDIRVYSADWCPYCTRAKRLLEEKGLTYQEINVDREPRLREELTQKTGHRTIPMIFIGDRFVGGFTDLAALDESGELDEILK